MLWFRLSTDNTGAVLVGTLEDVDVDVTETKLDEDVGLGVGQGCHGRENGGGP